MATLIANLTPVKLEPYINPLGARTLALEFVASQTIPRGTVIGQVTASGKGKPYATGNSDGSEIPQGFLVYDIVVDANGLVTYGPSGTTSDITRGSDKTAPIYWKGTFLQSDLTGLDSGGITALKGRVQGVGTLKTITIG